MNFIMKCAVSSGARQKMDWKYQITWQTEVSIIRSVNRCFVYHLSTSTGLSISHPTQRDILKRGTAGGSAGGSAETSTYFSWYDKSIKLIKCITVLGEKKRFQVGSHLRRFVLRRFVLCFGRSIPSDDSYHKSFRTLVDSYWVDSYYIFVITISENWTLKMLFTRSSFFFNHSYIT